MRLRRFLYIGGAVLLLLVKFIIDLVSKNVELEIGGLSLIREISVAGAFALLFMALSTAIKRHENAPVRRLGILLVITYGVLIASIGFSSSSVGGFDRKNLSLLPLDYATLFLGSISSIMLAGFAVVTLRLLSDLILYQPRRGTKRNYYILSGLILAAALSVVMLKPLEGSVVTTILVVLAILGATVNSFRLPWIVYLTKREKVFALIYGLLLFIAFTLLDVMLAQDGILKLSLLYYSFPLKQFVLLVMILGNVYFGMAFVSTLFHLPTADAFDRKRSEVTSLHNLSRLITQVFDFKELVETVTSMTLNVCEAKSCWLELVREEPSLRVHQGSAAGAVQVVALKNIGLPEIEQLHQSDGRNLREEVVERRAPVVIDDVAHDPRFAHLKRVKSPIASIVAMPLLSHNGLIGFLYATKDSAFGFMKDDVDVISAFADQATVAIENSRLINESIERERLLREMALAQEMQRKLLPQSVPAYPTLEVDAISTPAFEVGGDYYDFVELDERRLGVVVGDVSGKGVPAAFYMSAVKGVFQSLSRMYPSPRDFLIQANNVLMGMIERQSFVSLVFAVLDVQAGLLTIARAGHCPMLLVSGDDVTYVRPSGMGLGLSRDAIFSESLQELSIQLKPGDVCLFYTDGITEARFGPDEFGYDRLLEATRAAKGKSAPEIKGEVMRVVSEFVQQQPNEDDITLVVLKWRGERGVAKELATVDTGVGSK